MHSEERNVVKQLLLLFAIIFIVYSNSFANGFVWDDYHLIENNYLAHDLGDIKEIFSRRFFAHVTDQTVRAYWRPLVVFSFALDFSTWKNNVFGFHLTNFLLHSFNAALVLLLWRAVSQTRKAAFFAALIFAVHPAQTNAATYISGRTDLLAAAFFLTSCIFYIRYMKQAGKDAANVLGLCVTLLLSLMSKETALASPLAYLALGALTGGGLSRRGLGAVLASIATVSSYLAIRHLLHLSAGDLYAAIQAISARNLCAVAQSLFVYMRILFFPVRLHMERFLDVPSAIGAGTLPAPAAAILLIILAIRAAGRRNPVVFPLIFGFAAFLPTSNVIPIYSALSGRQIFMGEQFLYLPLAGLAASAGLAVAWMIDRAGKYGWTVRIYGILVCAVFALLSYAHNGYWRNNDVFYSETLSLSPGSVRINTNLGLLFATQGRHEEGIRLLRGVAARNPDSAVARLNLGSAYHAAGQMENARREIMAAKKLAPNSAGVFQAIGLLDMSEGKIDDAVKQYAAALEISPLRTDIRIDLATAYMRKSEYGKAERELKKAVSQDPSSLRARSLLASVLREEGKLEEAAAEYADIVRLHPDLAPAARELEELGKHMPGRNKPR